MQLEWQQFAACQGTDPDLFFGPDGERQPEREARERKAKAICRGCLVRQDCLGYAIGADLRSGVWGAMNEDERRNERRRQRSLVSYHRNKPRAA